MIAYEIFKGATAESLGMPEPQFRSRKATLDKFLAQWAGPEQEFSDAYLRWLREENKAWPSPATTTLDATTPRVEQELADATYSEILSGLADSVKAIAASGMKICDKDEHLRRFSICEGCDRFTGSRCRVCGCFMKIKSKFRAMSCPLKLWE